MDFKTAIANYRQEQRERSHAVAEMAVKNGCICPNQHRPVNGIIAICPSCLLHGIRSAYVIRKGDGMNAIWDDLPTRPPHPDGRHGPRMPVARDSKLDSAISRCAARIAASAPPTRKRKRVHAMDTKEAGQATAEGFAMTQNQPMQDIPAQHVNGDIPTFDATRIAPTSGPCAADRSSAPADEPLINLANERAEARLEGQ